jgi:hypothetical protein
VKIVQSTRAYEVWLKQFFQLDAQDLITKHQNMTAGAFVFLRATFYRWAQTYDQICPELQNCPHVLSVADLHVENFGTWRDSEGRLIWGVNDFDEAYPLPYTNDLVRLAASTSLAIEASHLRIGLQEACVAILTGYTDYMASGGQPFVLAENHPELRLMALGKLRDPAEFWAKLDRQCRPTKVPSEKISKALKALLPPKQTILRIERRRAGQGSLGRPRFVLFAESSGSLLAREAKALAPSAMTFAKAHQLAAKSKIYYKRILKGSIRCGDPFLAVDGNWVIRRLAPDCSRIDLGTLPKSRDERLLLYSMGAETANVHLGSIDQRKDVLKDLRSRHHRWLHAAAQLMSRSVKDDAGIWRKHLLQQ